MSKVDPGLVHRSDSSLVTEGGSKELSAVACRRAAAGGGASLRERVDRRRQASTWASVWRARGQRSVPTRVV
ncbi:hypothetical protein K0M31_015592 [Melipona bicolor]|uniref:Uncharacterized protein n=1 Tax=Melipona bicolor TaxID=60889 RepID=A0AA40FFI9_9HYME|nr:hypothetical protein K0M31_015592 [Melipona bicolor]